MKGCQKRKQKTIILSNAGLAGTGWETWRVGSNPTPVYFESNWYWYTKFSLPEPRPFAYCLWKCGGKICFSISIYVHINFLTAFIGMKESHFNLHATNETVR